MMPAVTVVYDTDGWAWHKRAMDLVEFAPEGYSVDMVSQTLVNHAKLVKSRRSIFYMSWFECPDTFARTTTVLLANPGIQHEKWKGRNPDENPWIACGTSNSRNRQNGKRRLPKFKRVICLTPELQRIATTLGAKAICIPTGINHLVFRPTEAISTGSRLKVGWCGQVNEQDPYNQKGFKWVAEPLMERCADFCDFQVNTRDYKTALSREEMVEWYNRIDVFLCTSICEGTPTTLLECMMCGRPAVSTLVGDVPHVVQNGHNGFAVDGYRDAESAGRVIEDLRAGLLRLHEDRQALITMGQNARGTMLKIRNWETLAGQWLRAIV